jgi:TPR repeat protein
VNLGNLYAQGLGVPLSLPTAMQWYRKAQEQYPEHVAELIQFLQQRMDGTGASDIPTAPGTRGISDLGGVGDAVVPGDATASLPVSTAGASGSAAPSFPTSHEFTVRMDGGRGQGGGQ